MRRSSIALTVLALVLSLAGAGPAIAQSAGAAAVYRDQLLVLHDKVQDALNKTKVAVASGSSQRERLALQKLVHRLGEEAADQRQGS